MRVQHLVPLVVSSMLLPAPTLAQAEPTLAATYGWAWAIIAATVVVALFVLLFKARPPVGREGH